MQLAKMFGIPIDSLLVELYVDADSPEVTLFLYFFQNDVSCELMSKHTHTHTQTRGEVTRVSR